MREPPFASGQRRSDVMKPHQAIMAPSASEGGAHDFTENEAFLSRGEQRQRALERIKAAADQRRHDRAQKILAQEGESLAITIGRVVYVSACMLFDGLILTEIIVYLGRTASAWAAFFLVLALAVKLQMALYDRFFSVDITNLE